MNWQPLDLSAPQYAIPPEPPAIVGLIYAGKRHVVSGPPESLKTLFTYIVALEHMRAGEKVALVDFEMGPNAARTLLEELGATPDEVADIYYVEPHAAPTEADLAAMLEAGVTLAVIDAAAGAYSVAGLDDNQRADAERFARTWIDPLWKRGVTTITVDHVTKNLEGRGKYAIGSERKVGGADVHLGLHVVRELTRGGSGLVRVDVHKDRLGFLARPAAAELELESDPDTHAITWTFAPASSASSSSGDGFRPTWYMDAVRVFLEGQDEPVSQRTVETGVGRRGEYVRRAIDCLAEDGVVDVARGPRNSKLISLRPRPDRVPDALTHSYPDGDAPTASPLYRDALIGTQSPAPVGGSS